MLKDHLQIMLLIVVLVFTACGSGEFEYNGLYWCVGPNTDTGWPAAKDWVSGLDGNWRMPSRSELRALYDSGISRDNWGPFRNSGGAVWSGETTQDHMGQCAWFFDFRTGTEYYTLRAVVSLESSRSSGMRAFAVRSR